MLGMQLDVRISVSFCFILMRFLGYLKLFLLLIGCISRRWELLRATTSGHSVFR